MTNLSAPMVSISEYLFNEYIDNIKTSPVADVFGKMDMLIDNDLAFKIRSSDDLIGNVFSKYRVACKWLIKNNKELKKYKRIPEKYEVGSKDNRTNDVNSKIVKLTKYILDSGRYICQLDDSNYLAMYVTIDNHEVTSNIYFIGDKWYSWYKKFNKECQKYNDLLNNGVTDIIYYTDGSRFSKSIFKSFDQLIMTDKNDIINYIDNWYNSIPMYKKYGVIPKLSILVHGEPGTGKSSFAKAVANHFDIHCIEKVTPSFFEDNDSNKSSINMWEPTVLLLDDIDCVAKSRTDRKSDDKNESKVAALLSFLDNPPTFKMTVNDGKPHDVSIIIATTNFYDKLDPAVKRYGRFDKKLEMNNFNKETAQQMCDLYDLKLEDVVKDSDTNGFNISPSHLQALCFEAVDKKFKDKM